MAWPAEVHAAPQDLVHSEHGRWNRQNHQRTVGVMTPSCCVLYLHPLQLKINLLQQQDSTEISKCSPGSSRNTGPKIPKSGRRRPRFVNGFTSGSACCSLGTSSANRGSHNTVVLCTLFIPSTRDKIVATRFNRNRTCSVGALAMILRQVHVTRTGCLQGVSPPSSEHETHVSATHFFVGIHSKYWRVVYQCNPEQPASVRWTT